MPAVIADVYEVQATVEIRDGRPSVTFGRPLP
jgi:hypothetical protein